DIIKSTKKLDYMLLNQQEEKNSQYLLSELARIKEGMNLKAHAFKMQELLAKNFLAEIKQQEGKINHLRADVNLSACTHLL
ncbi:MAG: hypothetical protein LUE64_02260, partial [Candidatus Gastranaerophilales bacterium]|nr:hypothetical protein [Candidatus Gastranaerophilales bacterium]